MTTNRQREEKGIYIEHGDMGKGNKNNKGQNNIYTIHSVSEDSTTSHAGYIAIQNPEKMWLISILMKGWGEESILTTSQAVGKSLVFL
jgi:hypothetical protein